VLRAFKLTPRAHIEVQGQPLLDPRKPGIGALTVEGTAFSGRDSVEVEVQAAYLAMFPHGDRLFVPQVFGWAIDCFTGSYRDYQAVDARYHDFEHTLQGTLCMARLLHGRYEAKAQPELTQRIVQLGLLAILLHDTGYLKKHNDSEGTGAKYTVTHVERSAEFAAQLLGDKGFGGNDIKSVQNMIHCTALLCRLGQGDVASFDDETYEILLSDEVFRPQIETDIAADKWLARETAHVEQMKREVICSL